MYFKLTISNPIFFFIYELNCECDHEWNCQNTWIFWGNLLFIEMSFKIFLTEPSILILEPSSLAPLDCLLHLFWTFFSSLDIRPISTNQTFLHRRSPFPQHCPLFATLHLIRKIFDPKIGKNGQKWRKHGSWNAKIDVQDQFFTLLLKQMFRYLPLIDP